jgi:hydrogenase 3 maturation protease
LGDYNTTLDGSGFPSPGPIIGREGKKVRRVLPACIFLIFIYNSQVKPPWQNQLTKKFSNAQRVCVIGVGNRDKGDDAAGTICAEMLAERLKRRSNIKVIDSGEVPENFTGEIRKFKPTHTVIIDSTIAGKKPGTIFLVDSRKIADTDVSTHRLPLSMLVRFLEESVGCDVIMIGIEPERIELNEPVSSAVKKAIKVIVECFAETLNTPGSIK